MKIRYLFVIVLLLGGFGTFSQTSVIKKSGVEWHFTQFGKNILKITCKPAGYTTDENISDAVILKPLPTISIKYSVESNVVRIGNSISLSFFKEDNGYNGYDIALQDNEKIYGGGERALPLNRRGYKFNFYNGPWYAYGEGADNLNFSVPFLTSSKGYGLFFDNPSKGFADIGKSNPNQLKVGFVSGELNVYVILGKDSKEILTTYTKLTGTQPLPPRWALGNFMSRFGYTSQEQVTDILAKMKEQNIPVDAVIFDLFWFGDSIKKTMGNLDWVNKTKWPSPKKMISDFKKQKVNTLLITEPFVLTTSLNYEASKSFHAIDSNKKPFVLTDFYFGNGGLIDIFRQDAQDWFWTKHKVQMKMGVESWWGDLGEPERHPSEMYHNLKDLGFKRLFKADEVHNIYGHYWTKMLFTKYAKEYPNKRLFSLNRSGFSGSQRYNIFPWSGDVGRNWSGLRAQLPVMLGMSMSGIPYIHADAGGFAGGDGDLELYVRWLQFAAFTPIFRPHGTALYEIDKAAFSFPSEPALIEEPYKGYVKDAIKLRYRLLPYNYTLSYLQTKNGEPLVSPLYYHFPKDTTAAKVENQYMWGRNILVAPILQKDEKEKNIVLPKGEWYSLTGGDNQSVDFEKYSSSITIYPSLHTLPVYVRAGSFIPMIDKPNGQNTTDYSTDSIELHYYSSNSATSDIMFDDDGVDKKSLALNKYEVISFSAFPTKKKLTVAINSTGGLKKKRNIKLVVHGPISVNSIAYVNGKKHKITIPYFGRETGPANLYSITFDYIGKRLKIEIK